VSNHIHDAPAGDGVEGYGLHEIADVLGITKRGAEIRAEKEGWPFTIIPGRGRSGGRRLYRPADLPDEVALALRMKYAPVVSTHPAQKDPTYKRGYGEVRHVTEAECAEAWAYWHGLKDHRKAVASERLFALREVLDLRAAGVPKMQARAQVGEMRGVSVASLTRWEDMVGDAPRSDWLALLCDGYKRGVGRKPYAQCAEVVWTWFRDHWLSRAQPSWADAYRRVREMAQAQGWACPSLSTLKRRVRKEIPYREQVMRREGPKAIRRLLPMQVRDALGYASGEAVNGDGVTFDPMWIRFEDGECIKGGKAWVWQDWRTRRYLAWRLDKTENTDVFRLATYDLTAVCAPRVAVIDNTRAAANKTMTAGVKHRHRFKSDPKDGLGLLLMLGIEPQFTNPSQETGNPGSKPIERSFGIGGVREMVLNNPRIIAAGGGRTEARAIDVALVREVIAEEVARFNAQLGRKTQACRDVLSFDQAWDEGLTGYVPRVLTAEQRRLLLMSREVVKLPSDRGQVYLKAGRWTHGRNAYWSEALSAYEGERVVMLFDPDHLHEDAAAYTLGGELIGTVQCISCEGLPNQALTRDHNRLLTREAKALKKAEASRERMGEIERAQLWGLARETEPSEAASATTGAGAATGATDAGGARVVQGHFQTTPGRARRRRSEAKEGQAMGEVVAIDAARRRAVKEATEQIFREKMAGIL